MRRFVIAFLLSGCLAQAAFAQAADTAKAAEPTKAVDPAKTADIRKLMEITGSNNISKQFAGMVTQQVFQMLKSSRPDIPERAMEVMNKELIGLFSERMAAPGGLAEQIVPIYDKYFTHAEIKELLTFYQTPIGKKAISVLPRIVNESMMAGQKWGKTLGPEIDKRVKAVLTREGLMPKPAVAAPAPAPAPAPAK